MMKSLGNVLAILFLTFTLSHAQETLRNTCAFGGVTIHNTAVNEVWTLETGGFGGAFISNSVYVGGAGYGSTWHQEKNDYHMGYGGLLLGYSWRKIDERSSLNFQLLSGYGGISEELEESVNEKSNFWVIKPGVEVEFGVTNWLRIGIGGGYRWIHNTDLSALSDRDLSVPYGNITFKFGNFNF